MNTRKNIAAVLGVGALMVAGLGAVGATPANADGLRFAGNHGRISVAYTQDDCNTQSYFVAPVNNYHNDARQDDRDNQYRANQGSNWNWDRRGDDSQKFDRDDASNFGKDRGGSDWGNRGRNLDRDNASNFGKDRGSSDWGNRGQNNGGDRR